MNSLVEPEPKVLSPNEVSAFNKECIKLLEELRDNLQIRTKIELFENKPYSLSSWNKKRAKFSDKPYTQELLKKIDEILEARLVRDGFIARNPAYIIFLLKNNYGYQDTRTVDSTQTHVFTVSRGDLKALKGKKVLKSTLSSK